MLTRLPFVLAILGMVGGVFIAILFGANEDLFHKRIESGLALNTKIQQIADPAEKAEKLKAEGEKNWRYYQRFHFHATGIGAMMMGLLLFLGRLAAPRRATLVASWLVAVGGFLYPFVWLFAGLYGPEMGRSEAKEAFAIFGYMGGLFLVGGVLTMVLAAKYPLDDRQKA
jgi:hypothetical protein